MIEINRNFERLNKNYLFTEMSQRIKRSGVKDPVSLGVGDIKLPLSKAVGEAFIKSAKEQLTENGFKGYPPTVGFDFLRRAIAYNYLKKGVNVTPDEIFVSDGAKTDIGSLVDLFSPFTALIQDPSYPPYLDDNVIKGNEIEVVAAKKENGFLPLPFEVEEKSYIIYLCSPGNPTGVAYTYDGLRAWVDFALKTQSVIIFDGAYCEYVTDKTPRTVFAVENAKYCAIEINSFSKWASFTGMRCGWTVIPSALRVGGKSLNDLYFRRQSTMFNGVNYCVQRAAEAAFSNKGYAECKETVKYYLENISLIKRAVEKKGIYCVGGESSPYLWLECPAKMSSMDFFDYLLNNYALVGTPGVGFGKMGEGYFRLTGFNVRSEILKAVEIIEKINI